MSTNNTTARAKLKPASDYEVYNIDSPAVPGQVFSQAIINGAKSILVRDREDKPGTLKYNFNAGEIGIKWATIFPGCSYFKDNILLNEKTLYMASDKAGHTIEIEVWY